MEKKTAFCFFVPKATAGENETKKKKKNLHLFFLFFSLALSYTAPHPLLSISCYRSLSPALCLCLFNVFFFPRVVSFPEFA